MGNVQEKSLLRFAAFGLCGLALINAALAAPPMNRGTGLHLDVRPMHLDLRPPTAVAPAEKMSERFPSSLHRQSLGAQEQDEAAPSGLAAEAPRGRIAGPVEDFARRVHREGLPVARLWENKSALVSLGLNQRGKPGLWLTQKVH
jgi:hypothetical protein